MKKILVRVALGIAVGLGAVAGFAYYELGYSPSFPEPELSAEPVKGTVQVGGRERSYVAFVPAKLAKGAPLLLVLHGSYLDGKRMRRLTGYEFDELADKKGFAVAYPDGYGGTWND